MNWDGYLQSGETIRWEGRPAPRCFTFRNWRHSLFGILLLLLAVYWQIIGYQLSLSYDSPLISWIPFPFLLAGLYLAVGHLVLARLEWDRVFYAATDRRLLAVGGLFRSRFQSIPLAEVNYFRIKPLGKELGTVRVHCAETPAALTFSCLEHPRRLTDLIEEAMSANGFEVPLVQPSR